MRYCRCSCEIRVVRDSLILVHNYCVCFIHDEFFSFTLNRNDVERKIKCDRLNKRVFLFSFRTKRWINYRMDSTCVSINHEYSRFTLFFQSKKEWGEENWRKKSTVSKRIQNWMRNVTNKKSILLVEYLLMIWIQLLVHNYLSSSACMFMKKCNWSLLWIRWFEM